MLLRLAPDGSFAAMSDEDLVGTAIGIDYGSFGWIAMMLVDPTWRGRGLGAQLLEAAMSAIPSDRPIRLDATPLGRPLYERYDFHDEDTLTRYVRDAQHAGRQSDVAVQPTSPSSAHFDLIASRDRVVFRADRRAVLEWIRDDAPQYAQIVRTDASGLAYCFGRPGRLFDQIGPVVAPDDMTACTVVAAALQGSTGGPVQIDAFDANQPFTTWLRSQGFRAHRPLFRMVRAAGARHTDPRVTDERAILGPEFA